MTVFSGSYRLYIDSVTSEYPQPFLFVIPFSTPFHYNPTNGNLLADVEVSTDFGFESISFDAAWNGDDSVSRVYAYGLSPPYTNGAPDTIGLITQFAVIPEELRNIAFAGISALQSGVVVRGTNGIPGGTYCVLTSSNLLQSVENWTRLSTNAFTEAGEFKFTNQVVAPHLYYRIQAQ